jgi:hypothetical protein
MGIKSFISILNVCAVAVVFSALPGCDNSVQDEIDSLSNPSTFTFTGTGTSLYNGTNYVFGTAAGTVNTSVNTIQASFATSDPPLFLYSTSAYSDSMYSGSCLSLPNLIATIVGANVVSTNLSATGCSDQAVININLDTSQVVDNSGLDGYGVVTEPVTVDLAPLVAVAPTGNTLADGTGTTEGSAGTFSMANDNSIVVTFTKNLTGGTFIATLTNCAATLGAGAVVTGTNGKTVAWSVTNFSAFTSGTTCTFGVAGVKDVVGNPDDPSDTLLSTTITFH